MGRIRTVKPELFQHAELFDAEVESGLPLRLAFIGLFTCCDREGRFKWRPRELKLSVLPHDPCEFSRVLDALATRGFLRKYASGSEVYGCIPSWCKHQVINNRESQSQIPGPLESPDSFDDSPFKTHVDDASGTRESPVEHARGTPLVGKGRERKGTGKEGNVSRGKREIDPRHREFRLATEAYWNHKNPALKMPWDGSEAKQLASLLSANPELDIPTFKQLLEVRARSEVNHSDRPRAWLARITDYAGGPLNQYGKPMNGGTNASFKSKTESNVSAAKAAIEAIENRAHADSARHPPASQIGGGRLLSLCDGSGTV